MGTALKPIYTMHRVEFSYDWIGIVAGRGLIPDPPGACSYTPVYRYSIRRPMDSHPHGDLDGTGLVMQSGNLIHALWVDLTMSVQL